MCALLELTSTTDPLPRDSGDHSVARLHHRGIAGAAERCCVCACVCVLVCVCLCVCACVSVVCSFVCSTPYPSKICRLQCYVCRQQHVWHSSGHFGDITSCCTNPAGEVRQLLPFVYLIIPLLAPKRGVGVYAIRNLVHSGSQPWLDFQSVSEYTAMYLSHNHSLFRHAIQLLPNHR